ncbi:MAG: cobalamin biosynthesis protein [Candidatus Bathyarchaeota archaeon]|nr:cobalamin biosynthesis protein [Candidatus Bathyarchaeota archaeon]
MFIDCLMMLFLAVFVDLLFGEPPRKLHPTVWMGKVISFLKKRVGSKNAMVEKLGGALMALFVIALFSLPIYFILFIVQVHLGRAAYIVVGALLLKPTFAIKCMKQYVLPISESIEKGNVDKARSLLPFIVRRNPAELDPQHIISAAIESVAESTVDGVTSPFFYFALFGVPGAFAFRAINTLDSMVGYKDLKHINIGWFSAKLDSLANYIPARLTALLMVLAAWLSHENWKSAWRILLRNKNKTESINAGWPMSAMAGALTVQLEKPGFYVLGEEKEALSPKHVLRALHIMELTAFLFLLLVAVPIQILIMMIV